MMELHIEILRLNLHRREVSRIIEVLFTLTNLLQIEELTSLKGELSPYQSLINCPAPCNLHLVYPHRFTSRHLPGEIHIG